MTEPVPSWVTDVPPAPVHGDLPRNYQLEQMTQDQARAMREKLFKAILQIVIQAITGFFFPNVPVNEQLEQWAEDRVNEITGVIEAVAGILAKVFLVNDLLEIITQHEDGDPNDLGSWFNARLNDIRSIITGIVNGLTGSGGTHWFQEDAETALANQAATVAGLSAAVTEFQNDQNNRGYGGNSATIVFSAYPDSASLPGIFTQTNTGSVATSWGVQDGRVAVYPAYDSDFGSIGRYNVKQTLSDYQLIGCSFSSVPDWFNSSTKGINRIQGRMNSSNNTFIFADLDKFSFELGCEVAGARTVWLTEGNFSFKANSNYWLECGTVGGARIFRVLNNDFQALATHTEVGTTSQLGASYRSTGMGCEIDASYLGSQNPGRVLAFGFSDNTPAPVIGVGVKMTRTDTSNVTATAGAHQFPSGYFNTPAEEGDNIDDNGDGLSVTIGITGFYSVNISTAVNTLVYPDSIQLLVYRDTGLGSAVYETGSDHIAGLNAALARRIPRVISEAWTGVYFEEGDVVSAGYDNGGSTTIGVFTGDAGGVDSYFTVSLENRSSN